MTVMMIGKKKCSNIKRTLLTGASSGTHPHEGKLECMLEKGPLKGSDGLDVRLYANGVSNADQEKGINAELKMNVEIPDPIVRFVSPPEIALYGRTTSKITGESVASMLLESNVEINGKPCLGILKITPTTLTCIAPETSSDSEVGLAKSVSPTEGPTHGENEVFIDGTGFGLDGEVVSAFVGTVPCTKTTLSKDGSRVRCIVPRRATAGLTLIRVEVSGVSSVPMAKSGGFHHLQLCRLRMDTLTPEDAPTYGNTTFKVFGRFLGRTDTHSSNSNDKCLNQRLVPEVHVGRVPCLESKLSSENGIEFGKF